MKLEKHQVRRLIEKIINAYPGRMRLLFQAYDISDNTEINLQTVAAAIKQHGKNFIKDMAAIIAAKEVQGPHADGDEDDPTGEEGSNWLSGWLTDNADTIFGTILSGFTSLFGGGGNQQNDDYNELVGYVHDLEAQNRQTRTIMIVSIVAVVAVMLMVIVLNKKN
ncbi:MAG: hypothetical protein K9H26_10760 [Prolixibacteraceae bacterium]|nr:hypothetical protein [Prolixibacteraceae bacterium]